MVRALGSHAAIRADIPWADQPDASKCYVRLLGKPLHDDSKHAAFRALAGGRHQNLLKRVVLHLPSLAKHADAHNEKPVRFTEIAVFTDKSVSIFKDMVQFRADLGNNLSIVKCGLCRSWQRRGAPVARSMRKVGAGGVGRQRNRLVDNELTRQTPCAKPSCKVGAGGVLAPRKSTHLRKVLFLWRLRRFGPARRREGRRPGTPAFPGIFHYLGGCLCHLADLCRTTRRWRGGEPTDCGKS